MVRAWLVAANVVVFGMGTIGLIAFLLGFDNVEARVWQYEKSFLSLLMTLAVFRRVLIWADIIADGPVTEPTEPPIANDQVNQDHFSRRFNEVR